MLEHGHLGKLGYTDGRYGLAPKCFQMAVPHVTRESVLLEVSYRIRGVDPRNDQVVVGLEVNDYGPVSTVLDGCIYGPVGTTMATKRTECERKPATDDGSSWGTSRFRHICG